MPTFNDSEPAEFAETLPEGDYVLTVVKFEQKVSTGQKTAGCDLYLVDFRVDPAGRCSDCLVDSPGAAWRIDLFLKASGVKIAKGASFEFRQDKAQSKHVEFINPLGLRCWAHVVVEEYTSRTGAKRTKNKVGAYLLGRKPLDRVELPDAEDESPAADVSDEENPFNYAE